MQPVVVYLTILYWVLILVFLVSSRFLQKLDIFISICNKQDKKEEKQVTFLLIINAKFIISYSEQANTHIIPFKQLVYWKH